MGRSFDYVFLYYIIGFGAGAIFGIWSRSVAVRKGRDPILWFLAGFLTLFVAVIALHLLPTATAHPYLKVTSRESKKSLTMNLVKCPRCSGSMLEGAFACAMCGLPRLREASQAGISKDASGKATVASNPHHLSPSH